MDDVTKVLDYIEVEGFKVRPWGITALAKLSPHLEKVITELRSRGVTLKGVKEGDIGGVIFSVLPSCPDILAITLEIPLEEVGKLSAERSMKVLLAIATTNMDYLKNWLGPFAEATRAAAGFSK